MRRGLAVIEWRELLPPPNTANRAEQVRASAGALFGLFLTGAVSYVAVGQSPTLVYLIAPMGASAVLLFCLPASPLAQPWSIIGGNLVSGLIGVTCANFIATPLVAAAVAGCLAIGAMFILRCLHPPSGAVALTMVLGGPVVHAAGYHFLLAPVAINSLLLVTAAVLFNNATGRRYPHVSHSGLQPVHKTKDPAPIARFGFSEDDLDAVLRRYNQVLDVSRDDLEAIFLQTEMHAYKRRFGVITCADIMSRDVIRVSPTTASSLAWRLMHEHRVQALPVLDAGGQVVGMISQSDFLQYYDPATASPALSVWAAWKAAFRSLLHLAPRPQLVGQMMDTSVQAVHGNMPIVDLIALMAGDGLHHLPVVDEANQFVGMVTQSDLVAALYESRLAESGLPSDNTPM